MSSTLPSLKPMIIIIITRKAEMVICFVSSEKITGSDKIEELSPRKEQDTAHQIPFRVKGEGFQYYSSDMFKTSQLIIDPDN
ncbi:hypothetical protein NC652_033235 [Populus alba x Populus x berolinensis]|nr:hypothetical protein NC652_033183 [Populus alba x Populus x berolinensis]KAJ6879844.1 hypothetical protein NC652_033235 [Populus alba x Populus x berolinensis]